MRYLVFVYATYYPVGGMNDCELKTDSLVEAVGRAMHERDENFNHVHVYDTQTGVFVEIPEEDVEVKTLKELSCECRGGPHGGYTCERCR